MKHLWILFLTLSLSTASLAKKPEHLKLGKLTLGQPASRVIRILGEPKEKGEAIEEAATGDLVQRWSYPQKGLELDLSKAPNSQGFKLYRIYAKRPCELAGYRGINVGSFAVEVRAVARGLAEAKGTEVTQNKDGCSILWADTYELFSTTFKEGKVSEIYLGPGPE